MMSILYSQFTQMMHCMDMGWVLVLALVDTMGLWVLVLPLPSALRRSVSHLKNFSFPGFLSRLSHRAGITCPVLNKYPCSDGGRLKICWKTLFSPPSVE